MLPVKQVAGASLLMLLFVVPLGLGFVLLGPGIFDGASFTALFQHPQFFGAIGLTLFTGLVSTGLALLLAVAIVMGTVPRLLSGSGVLLALPHLALALGLGFVLAPTGLLARLFVGGETPPNWEMVQDPAGFGLIVALVLKETPFLIWAMVAVLESDELRLRYRQEMLAARSMGHGPGSSFLKVVLPQVLPRITWPLVAVFSYGLTVVDMALVIGPAQPPTLAQLLWTDLNDGETSANGRGAAGTLLLTALTGLLLLGIWALTKLMRPKLRFLLTTPARPEWGATSLGKWFWAGLILVYSAIILALMLQSVSLHWPYPDILAQQFSTKAWQNVAQNLSPLLVSLGLAIATSCAALLAVVVWFETQNERRDRVMLVAAVLVLCVPALMIALGQYRLLLTLGMTGTLTGLFIAHLLPVVAYVFVMLHGPYRAYDKRWKAASAGLGVAGVGFLRKVKWPMLYKPLLSTLAVGFAVSVAQFIPAQLAAAGRFSTLPMEAVTLSSGGNRALISVYGLMLMLLPLIGFLVASRLTRSRWQDA